MPRLLIHGLVGIPVSFFAAYMLGPTAGLILFTSSFLVDIDHLVVHYMITRDWTWNIRNEYVSMSEWWRKVAVLPSGELEPRYLPYQFLHRIELWIVIAYFAPSPLNMIGVGALSNLFLDVIEFPKRIKYLTVTTDIMMFAHHLRSQQPHATGAR